MGNIDMSEFKEFNVLDYITNAEHAKNSVYAAAMYAVDDGDAAPEEWVDRTWEDIKHASDRHGFAITPALQDAYAWARARAAERDSFALNSMIDSLYNKENAVRDEAVTA